jgi:hypothetical protein
MSLGKAAGAPKDEAGLREWLKHPNAWQRETAQRLLAERGEPWNGRVGAKRGPQNLFSILNDPDGKAESVARLVAGRAAAIVDAPEDVWMARAVLSASVVTSGRVLERVLAADSFTHQYSAQRSLTVQWLGKCCER